MLTKLAFPLALATLLAAISAPSPARGGETTCPKGKLLVRGQCFEPCPTGGDFSDVDACECPQGFGKILLGGGGGRCMPRACPTRVEFVPYACECPAGYAMRKLPKGKAICEIKKPKAPPKAAAHTEKKEAATAN